MFQELMTMIVAFLCPRIVSIDDFGSLMVSLANDLDDTKQHDNVHFTNLKISERTQLHLKIIVQDCLIMYSSRKQDSVWFLYLDKIVSFIIIITENSCYEPERNMN